MGESPEPEESRRSARSDHQAELGADAKAGLMRIPVFLSVEVSVKKVVIPKKLDLDRGCYAQKGAGLPRGHFSVHLFLLHGGGSHD